MDARNPRGLFLFNAGSRVLPESRTGPGIAGTQRGFLCTFVLIAGALDGIWADGSRNRAGPAVQQISRLITEANRNPFPHPFSDVAHRPESTEIGSNFCWPTSG